MLAAGLDGIRRELPVPEATEENIYLLDKPHALQQAVLPGSLNQALNALEEDEVIREALGAHTHEAFINAKRLEWEDYRLEVTDWELRKYLPSF
jgi:glutamine synthetase